MSPVPPWEVTPALQLPRLLTLARFAVEARNTAVADARRDAGDTNWGIGCRAYERFIFRVTTAAASRDYPWLRLLREGLSVTMDVEGVLIRAYTGRADKPEARHVLAARADAEPPDDRQLALFSFAAPNADENRWVWLMAVETDAEGHAARVTFFQADTAGETRNAWDAPMAELLPKPEAKPQKARAPKVEPRRVPVTASLFD